MQKTALYTSGVIFAAGGIFHLLRLITGFEITAAGYVVPMWGSFPGTLAGILLAVWMVVAARRMLL